VDIVLITPAGPRSRYGNRNTAVRWAGFLRELGHRVALRVTWDGSPAQLMIALHARRSHDSIARFRAAFPDRPLALVLTGTDLYRDIQVDADARRSLRLADRLVVLQEMGLKELPLPLRRKTSVIYQSAREPALRAPLKSCFEVVVSGHLREEKDPFRAAAALHLLPRDSRIRITHIGGAMTEAMAREARSWMRRESRYHWLGERPHWEAVGLIGRSRVMVISSRMEGGANVVCEALAAGVPVIASRISGNIGMLGRGYSGYFAAGNEEALARMLARAEGDPIFLRKLHGQTAGRRHLVRPRREKRALARLLADVASS
jgi:putative glycosyltransferase (TIGR04348 family)